MSATEIGRLRNQAREVYSDHAAALVFLQEAERLATDDEETLFEIRIDICLHATFSDQFQTALVTFPWLLQTFDRNPNLLHMGADLLWRYKYVLHQLPSFPGISLEKIDSFASDFQKRLKHAGYSPRTGIYMQAVVAIECGNWQLAQKLSTQWPRLRRDYLSDCHACEADKGVEIDCALGNWESCLSKARRILNGELSCLEVPHITLPLVAKAQFHSGKAERAAKTAAQCTRLTEGKPEFLKPTSHLIEFHLMEGNIAAGLLLIEKRLPWIEKSQSPLHEYLLMSAAGELLKRAEPSQELRLPADFLERKKIKNARADTLLTWLQPRVEKLEAQFNKRNGNDFFSQRRQQMTDGAR